MELVVLINGFRVITLFSLGVCDPTAPESEVRSAVPSDREAPHYTEPSTLRLE